MKKAFITGMSGQDGSYLAEYLVELGYEVHGIVRHNSIPEHQQSRLDKLNGSGKIKTYYGDLLDKSSLYKLLSDIMPDEIYNLAAQSHVRISFDNPEYTCMVDAIGVLNLLEIYRLVCPKARFYQASSSEMFGNNIDPDGFQRETTPMNPVSPYGCAKVFAYNLCRNYRHSYGLHISNGILFNHESPRRGTNFVTNKVVKAAVRIKLGLQKKLVLGNLESYRDWGHAKDYIKVMHKIVNHNEGDDFVVATGVTHSVRELCEYVFGKLDMDYKKYVEHSERYLRPEELQFLKGDCSKAREKLGFKLEYTFETMLDDMIDHWLKVYEKGSKQNAFNENYINNS